MNAGKRLKQQAIGLKLSSVALFVVMQALVKYTADRVPPGEAVCWMSLRTDPAAVEIVTEI